jgi:hypothetical protein
MSLRAVVCGLLLACALGLGAARYRDSIATPIAWPRWTRQVSLWEQNPRHEILIWPPKWKIMYLLPWRDTAVRPRAEPGASPRPARRTVLPNGGGNLAR